MYIIDTPSQILHHLLKLCNLLSADEEIAEGVAKEVARLKVYVTLEWLLIVSVETELNHTHQHERLSSGLDQSLVG